MKQEVVKEIRANGQLESDLNEMDIKIGLLVKNRVTLQVALSLLFSLPRYILVYLRACIDVVGCRVAPQVAEEVPGVVGWRKRRWSSPSWHQSTE